MDVVFNCDLDEDKVVGAFFSANIGLQFLLPFLRVCFYPWEDGTCTSVSSLSLVPFSALCNITQELSHT